MTSLEDASPPARGARQDRPESERADGVPVLLPMAEKPFILGAPAALSVWAAALRLSRSLYS
jgi:hypothetical protein